MSHLNETAGNYANGPVNAMTGEVRFHTFEPVTKLSRIQSIAIHSQEMNDHYAEQVLKLQCLLNRITGEPTDPGKDSRQHSSEIYGILPKLESINEERGRYQNQLAYLIEKLEELV